MYIQLGNNTNELLIIQTNKNGIKNRDIMINTYAHGVIIRDNTRSIMIASLHWSPLALPLITSMYARREFNHWSLSGNTLILAKSNVLPAATIAHNLSRFALQFVSILCMLSFLFFRVVLCAGNAEEALLSLDMSRF